MAANSTPNLVLIKGDKVISHKKINMKSFLIKMGLALIAITAPIHALMVATGVVIFMDAVTGIWGAYKSGEKITSAGLRRTVTKMAVYQVAILSGFLMEMYFLPGLPVVKLIAATIGIVEFKSILENLDRILGTSLFKTLIKKLGSDNDKPGSQQ